MKTEKELLETILVAETLILSELIKQDKERKGTTRLGGDYTKEAMSEIKRSHQKIIALLLQP